MDLSVDVLCVAPELVHAAARGETSRRVREAYTEQIKREGMRILVATERLLHREGLTANVVLELGSASDVILERAADYDLVVVGGASLLALRRSAEPRSHSVRWFCWAHCLCFPSSGNTFGT
jgi:nucleotide-binding universal stress UspA family protein